ncbi:MAG: lipoyl(octanoyl) transferase LipB [Bacteroidota bacterium]
MPEEKNIVINDLGLIDYQEAWDIQEALFNHNLEVKKSGKGNVKNNLLFCEHPHVYTLGKSGQPGNLLVDDDFLKKIDASFYRINRGGDITYHGPGQIVGYPILDLDFFNISIREYIWIIEEAIIRTIYEYGLLGGRLDGASGVWLDTQTNNARKICAIGVRASRHITMHGFAFNVKTDLDYFGYINPCGFSKRGVTSLEKELRKAPSLPEVKRIVTGHLTGLLQKTE